MIQQNELITFLVGVGTAIFILLNWRRTTRIPGSLWLFLCYGALFSGWTFTLVEGFILAEVFNALEHACYAISSLSAAVWCWTILLRGDKVP